MSHPYTCRLTIEGGIAEAFADICQMPPCTSMVVEKTLYFGPPPEKGRLLVLGAHRLRCLVTHMYDRGERDMVETVVEYKMDYPPSTALQMRAIAAELHKSGWTAK